MSVKIKLDASSDALTLPPGVAERANLGEEVEAEIEDGRLVLRPVGWKPRDGWEESITETQRLGLDDTVEFADLCNIVNDFDRKEPPWPW